MIQAQSESSVFFFSLFCFLFFLGFLFIISSQRARLAETCCYYNSLRQTQNWRKNYSTSKIYTKREIQPNIQQKKRTIRYQFYKKSHKKRENKTKPNTKSTKKDYPGAYTSHLSYFFARKMWTWKSTKAITIYTLMWRRTKSDERCPIFSIKTGTWTSTFELVSSFLFNVANQIKYNTIL